MREVKKRVVAFCRWLRRGYGLERKTAAEWLWMNPLTLRRWERAWEADRMAIEERGRPAARPETERRNLILAVFGLLGPDTSVETMQVYFPDVARRELEETAARFREVWRKKGVLIHALIWPRVGAAWAMDFTDTPAPMEGTYRHILSVRDLASGHHLMALPAERAEAEVTRDALRALFREHGAPLVVKSDNGGHFTADIVRNLLAEQRVAHLLSPGGTPSYNGAAEAGIGALKTRAHYESARHDRPGDWTCDDIELARLRSNQSGRFCGVSPDQLWDYGREPITDIERALFAQDVREKEAVARVELGYLPGILLSEKQQDEVNRIAISRALIEGGFLLVRRRRISPPVLARKARKIS